MNRDKLRESIAESLWRIENPNAAVWWSKLSFPVKGKWLERADTILKTPAGLILSRECERCEDGKHYNFKPDYMEHDKSLPDSFPCPTCKGTGKQTRRMTLEEMVEWINQGNRGIESLVKNMYIALGKTFTAHDGEWEVNDGQQ